MNIQHNLSAIKLNNNLAESNKLTAKSMEKLATGLRINLGADEAAGLSISEKMRGQIRGLHQAQRNIQDGISLTSTADGGLSVIQDQLQRARELTVQAANGTLSPEDRQGIQKEVEHIKKGIDDIADNTDFNGIKLLNGTKPEGYSGEEVDGDSQYRFENVLSLSVAPDGSFNLRTDEGYPTTENDDNQVLVYGAGVNSRPALLIGSSSYDLKSAVSEVTREENGVFKTVSLIEEVRVTQTVKIVDDKYEFKYSIANTGTQQKDVGFYFHMDMMLGDDDAAPFVVNGNSLAYEESFNGNDLPEVFSVYNNNGNPDLKAMGIVKGSGILEEPAELRIGQYADVANAIGWTDSNEPVGDSGYGILWATRPIPGGQTFEVNTLYGLDIPPTIEDPTEGTIDEGPYDIRLQIGANAGETMKVKLSDVRSTKLGIEDIEIDPFAKAMEALGKLDVAIQKISGERSKYGAYHNRLDHTYSMVSESAQNLTAAESRIRDTDMAKEIINLTKNSILTETTQAMLAQANRKPQQVLELLK